MAAVSITTKGDPSSQTVEAYWVADENDITGSAFTDLLEAVQLHNLGKVREILNTGLSLDTAPQPLPPMTPPLIEAVYGGHRDLVEMLLEQKADLSARDVGFGGTALHWAAASGSNDILGYLLERALDVNCASFSGQTPLHAAAACGHESCVRLLLSDNAQPDIVDLKGDTPLHEAAGAGHVPVTVTLLAGRANPNVANLESETPLMRASRRGYSGVVEALLERGARMDTANRSGITALISAAFYGHKPVVVTLLKRGANARLVDAKKRGALHWAALNNNDAVVKDLLVWAADTSKLLDEGGASPLDLAMQADAENVIRILNSL